MKHLLKLAPILAVCCVPVVASAGDTDFRQMASNMLEGWKATHVAAAGMRDASFDAFQTLRAAECDEEGNCSISNADRVRAMRGLVVKGAALEADLKANVDAFKTLEKKINGTQI